MKIAFILVLLITSMFSYADLSEKEVAELLKYNVVSINSSFGDDGNDIQHGFGWVIAKSRTQLYIVTAEHVVKQKKGDFDFTLPTDIDVRFFDDPVRVYTATLTQASSFDDLDVAIIKVPMPTRQPWLYSAISDEGIVTDEKVSFVGNGTAWLVPEQSGVLREKVTNSNANARYDYIATGLSLDVGTSGGPLISKKGIVGMIVTHSSEATGIVSIEAIKKIVTEESGLPWSLQSYAKPLELNGIWGPKTANIPEAVRLQFSEIDAAHFKYSLSLPSVPTFDKGVGVIDGDRVRIWQPLSNGEESYGEYQVYTEKNQTEVLLMDGNLSHGGRQQASVRLAKMLESDDIKTANTLDPRTVKLMKQNPTIVESFANRLEQAAEQNG